MLICQKRKDHLVTVHIQFSSSVVPTGGVSKILAGLPVSAKHAADFFLGGGGVVDL